MKLVILDDQVTPYRIPLFTGIAKRVDECWVLFRAARSKERDWEIPIDPPSPHEFLSGFTFRLRRPPYNDLGTILVKRTHHYRLVALDAERVACGQGF